MDIGLVGALAEVVAALATAGAVGWAAWEFHRKRQADLEERAAEIESVTISYKLLKPRVSEVRDEAGTYAYDFTLHNPGRLPLVGVSVAMQYPGPVRRIHRDGGADAPQAGYEMYVAVVPAHGSFTWHRQISVPVELMAKLRNTRASITFRTADAGRVTTTWPAPPPSKAKPALRKKLHPSTIVAESSPTIAAPPASENHVASG